MMRFPGVALLLGSFVATGASAIEYKGLCEASAGAFITDTHFAVASDETNRLQIYERGKPDPIGQGADFEPFTSFDKSDLEAAARIGDRVYWISSHSLNKQGEDKAKRKVLFATQIVIANGKPTLNGIGKPAKALRDPLAKAAGVQHGDLNIEAMAATPAGGLLIGMRKPGADQRALVIALENPAAVVDKGEAPKFGSVESIDLKGRGLRSMDLLPGSNPARYIIVAGPESDSAEGFALYLWGGPGTAVDELKNVNLAGIKPEGVLPVPDQKVVQLLSDDGDSCSGSDEDGPDPKRKFRSIDINLP